MSEHWDDVYASKADTETSWFQPAPSTSLDLLDALGITANQSVIDVGGGRSHLVDALVQRGHHDLTVLDISAVALQAVQERLPHEAISRVLADASAWEPQRTFDTWHDRAAFHFLTEPERRAGYFAAMRRAVHRDSIVVIATFADDGPEQCSGLPVSRYSPEQLAATVSEGLQRSVELRVSRRVEHRTPWDAVQPFSWIGLVVTS